MLDGYDKFVHNKLRIDHTAAFMHSCCSLIEPPDCVNRQNRVDAFYAIMDTIADDALDIIAHVIVNRLYNAKLVSGITSAKSILKRLRPMLDASQNIK